MSEQTAITSQPRREEMITIIATSMDEVWREYRAQGLAEQRFSITGRTGQHRFKVAGEQAAMFGGAAMVAATFARIVES